MDGLGGAGHVTARVHLEAGGVCRLRLARQNALTAAVQFRASPAPQGGPQPGQNRQHLHQRWRQSACGSRRAWRRRCSGRRWGGAGSWAWWKTCRMPPPRSDASSWPCHYVRPPFYQLAELMAASAMPWGTHIPRSGKQGPSDACHLCTASSLSLQVQSADNTEGYLRGAMGVWAGGRGAGGGVQHACGGDGHRVLRQRQGGGPHQRLRRLLRAAQGACTCPATAQRSIALRSQTPCAPQGAAHNCSQC